MGKDVILGTVEIPLSDLPNANSTNSRVTEASLEGKKSQSDGFCERWYRLLSRNDMSANTINPSKPIENPHRYTTSITNNYMVNYEFMSLPFKVKSACRVASATPMRKGIVVQRSTKSQVRRCPRQLCTTTKWTRSLMQNNKSPGNYNKYRKSI